MINRTVLIGRLTKDPELRTTNNGISVLQFTLAVDRQFTNANGERGADFISCVAWRKNAENINKFFSKGSAIGIDGRIQTRTYKDNDNRTVFVTEVVIDSWCFIGSKKEQQEHTVQSAPSNNQSNWHNPAKNIKDKSDSTPANPKDPFGSQDTIDISEDDLPF